LRYLRRVFPYYTKPTKGNLKADLDTHIGLNPGPDVSSADYKKTLRQLVRYIKGGRKEIIQGIEKKMQRAAEDHEFEAAAKLRNQLGDLRALQQRIMFGDKEFLDISKDRALSDLAFLLGLKKIPSRIEGYDISHISGTDVVASMVVFANGTSDRAEYRKFKMRQQKNDDYANMYEVISRRFSEKNVKNWVAPELVLIDGGKGQLDAAIRALRERDIRGVAVVSVAKRNEEILVHNEHSGAQLDTLMAYAEGTIQDKGIAVRKEGVYVQVNLHVGSSHTSGHAKNLRGSVDGPARYSDVTKLIQRIRDESHRFAISYHSVLRGARQTASALDTIPGVGPVTRKKLLRTFGSMRGVKEASLADITAVIGASKATLVYQERAPDESTPSNS
jgi:excinuclease ABC subunit C